MGSVSNAFVGSLTKVMFDDAMKHVVLSIALAVSTSWSRWIYTKIPVLGMYVGQGYELKRAVTLTTFFALVLFLTQTLVPEITKRLKKAETETSSTDNGVDTEGGRFLQTSHRK